MTTASEALMSVAEPISTSISIVVDAASALSTHLISVISEACDRAEDTGDGAKLVMHLRGKAAESGVFPWPGDNISLQLVSNWERVLRRLEQLPGVIIAAADGVCGAAALEIFACSDFRIATNSMGVRRETLASWPGMLVYRIAKELGTARARTLLQSTDLSAREIAHVGLVDMVVADLAKEVSELLARIGDLPTIPICRRLLSESFSMTYEDALGIHLAACDKLLRLKHQR